MPRRVLVIGWDAADWKHITPLLEQGLMPTLEGLINRGVMGNISTLEPVLSPMLWNSIATGKRPEHHGILGFMEPDPHSAGIRPVTSTSRKVKAVWNILTQRGLKSHVVGWFAGHPAEPIRGVCVSPLYAKYPDFRKRELPPDSVHPVSLRQTLDELRIFPEDLGPEEVLTLVPRAAGIDQAQDKRIGVLCKILAENCSIHNAATWLLQNEPWDFAAVYYDGIDHFCHAFMPFHPPRLDWVPEDLYETYKDVVAGAYRFHDMMLETLLRLAGPDTNVILLSDHGFHSDHLRPRGISDEPAGPALWHRKLGVICMAGPGIKADERIYGATLLDITPTILALFDLPIGRDMQGKVLLQAFEQTPAISMIDSWENEPGESGMHPADLRMDPEAAQAMLEEFVALGYVEQPSEDQSKARAAVTAELKYNLARALVDAGNPREALPLLEQLVSAQPDRRGFRIALAECYLAFDRIDEAAAIFQPIIDAGRRAPVADLILGLIHYRRKDMDAAFDHWRKAEAANPRLPRLHIYLGHLYLRRRMWTEAECAFQKALGIDTDSAAAYNGLARALLGQRRNEEALEAALTAVGLQHHLPDAHYRLGIACARLGHFDRAALAFETTLTMHPNWAQVKRWRDAVVSAARA